MSEWTLKKLLDWTSRYFTEAHLEQPRLAAEILLAHVLGCPRIDLYVRFDSCPPPDALSRFRELVKRAAAQEPVAYLTGRAHFFSLEFEVTPAVLIPRPETEILVAAAIDFCRHETRRPTVDVLDLCTGSGCVAVAIASQVVEVELVASDRSEAALEIARRNIEKHDLQARISVCQSDLFDALGQAPKAVFDLIVANPPYIARGDYEQLPANVRREPDEALLAGEDGLEIQRRIAAGAGDFLADDGCLLVETAYDQADRVTALFQQAGTLKAIQTIKDNLGHQRVVKARKA